MTVNNELNGNVDNNAIQITDLDDLLNQHFKGRVVRKDLTPTLAMLTDRFSLECVILH